MIRAIPVVTPLRRKRLLEVQKMMVPAAAKIPDATRKETREARLSPFTGEHWKAKPRGADRLARTLRENLKLVFLFRDLATLRKTEPTINSPAELFWKEPHESFVGICDRLDAPQLVERVSRIAHLS